MERFSKGPWHYDEKSSAVKNDDGYVICSVESYEVPEIVANISLIAAAPEMYEMLESLAEDYGIYNPVHKQIQALLAKARGEKCQQQ